MVCFKDSQIILRALLYWAVSVVYGVNIVDVF